MMSGDDEAIQIDEIGALDDDDEPTCSSTAVDFVYEADDLLKIREADELVEIKDELDSLNAFPLTRSLLRGWTEGR
jgi:hypothetical protein